MASKSKVVVRWVFNHVGNHIYKENVMKNSFKKGKKHVQSHTDEEKQSLAKKSIISQQRKEGFFSPCCLQIILVGH